MFRNIVTDVMGTGTERQERLGLILTGLACLVLDAIIGLTVISVAWQVS